MKERLQDWLTAEAERHPEATAVVFDEQPTTYAALEQASNRLARALRTAGCARGDRVGMLLPKSPRALVAMFGVLKADCIYVPIDIGSPPARIERILQVCECRCLLAERSTASLAARLTAADAVASATRVVFMDEGTNLPDGVHPPFFWDDVETFSPASVESRNVPADPAHILFTSGSTGIPKGVVITHSSVVHFVQWAVKYFGVGRNDRISGHAPLHFDLSTFDIYATIAAGARIHLLPPEVSFLPHRLADFIRDSELTQWFSVPSALLSMAKYDVLRQGDFPALRRLLWCGEKFPTPALIYFMRRLPHVTFVNLYGPTETTIASSYYRVPRCPANDRVEIPIGFACEGEELLVLDDQLQPAAPGEIGNLYIGGVGLSPGYWKDPAKTDAVFRSNPFSPNPSDRIYHSGDLAKVGHDGLIYLVGRKDSQIKSGGARIELGEIEAAVHAVPGILDAAVVALEAPDGAGMVICCVYVPAAGYQLSPADLKEQVSLILPRYMIPARWLACDSMPRNHNGKTDRVRLKLQIARETEAEDGAASSDEDDDFDAAEAKERWLRAG